MLLFHVFYQVELKRSTFITHITGISKDKNNIQVQENGKDLSSCIYGVTHSPVTSSGKVILIT